MKGEYKPFNKSLYQRNDPKSRKVVKEYFLKNNIPLDDNENKFGVDLISIDNSLCIEVEHRLIWKTKDFPYEDVNIPERKGKFFVSNNICYVILSNDFSRIGMIDGKTLRKYLTDDTLKESSNKYVKQGELFYKIPKSAFKWDNV